MQQSLDQLMRQNGMTNAQLAELADLSEAVISKLRTGYCDNPRLSTLLAICRVLHCSLDELVGYGGGFTQDAQIMELLRKIDPKDKQTIINMLRLYPALQEPGQNTVIRVVFIPNEEGDDITVPRLDFFEKMELPATLMARKCDCVLRIISDKLFPVYQKGDLLAICNTWPDVGKRGVFIYNGKVYFREYFREAGRIILQPLVKYRTPIVVDGNLDCFGTIMGTL